LLTCFESYVLPAQGPCCFGPAQASDVIILDTPRVDLSDLSSISYSLSLFSSKVGPHPRENVSISEFWPEIGQLDEASPGDTSMNMA
jgi:hypothetical protein